jgi:hypothetical protein
VDLQLVQVIHLLYFLEDQHQDLHAAFNESWNGSAWTELADLNTARGLSVQEQEHKLQL